VERLRRKRTLFGLVSQEVDAVLPELVLRHTEPEKPLGLNYVGLVPVTIRAVQEQQSLREDREIEKQQEQILHEQEQNRKLEGDLPHWRRC